MPPGQIAGVKREGKVFQKNETNKHLDCQPRTLSQTPNAYRVCKLDENYEKREENVPIRKIELIKG